MAVYLEQVKSFFANAKNLLSLLRTHVWQKPKRNTIFMIAEAYVVELAFVTGSMAAKVHIPQHAIK
jgi:hypothetical protein